MFEEIWRRKLGFEIELAPLCRHFGSWVSSLTISCFFSILFLKKKPYFDLQRKEFDDHWLRGGQNLNSVDTIWDNCLAPWQILFYCRPSPFPGIIQREWHNNLLLSIGFNVLVTLPSDVPWNLKSTGELRCLALTIKIQRSQLLIQIRWYPKKGQCMHISLQLPRPSFQSERFNRHQVPSQRLRFRDPSWNAAF